MNHRSLLALCALAACVHGAAPRAPVVEPTQPLGSEPRLAHAASSSPSCVASRPPHAERIAQHGSVLEQYDRQDGVWLPHAPVLVNEDFDFVLAMSMEDGLGAGLAAAKRRENNRRRAQELAELRLGEAVDAKIEALCACGRDVYFVLWGREGKIKMVVDGSEESNVIDGEGAAGADGVVRRAGELLAGAECS